MIYMGDGVKNLNGEVYDTNLNGLFFGSLGNPKDDEQVALIDELFTRADVRHQVMEDMLYTYWRKYVLIVSFNQACAVFGSDYSVFHNVPRAMQLAEKLIDECIPLAKAAGVKNADALKGDIMGAAMGIAPECIPSIVQDRTMQRRMEVDIFSDEIIERSRALGLEAPYNEMVSLILNVINEQNGFAE
jgi:ketopantoate reductase